MGSYPAGRLHDDHAALVRLKFLRLGVTSAGDRIDAGIGEGRKLTRLAGGRLHRFMERAVAFSGLHLVQSIMVADMRNLVAEHAGQFRFIRHMHDGQLSVTNT